MIQKLSGGYEQMLGCRFEGGVDLSGGEWQKMAIARAYLRDAQLLILDEPTASLDAEAEHQVFERFAELTRGKMALLIRIVSRRFAWPTEFWCSRRARFLRRDTTRNSSRTAAATRSYSNCRRPAIAEPCAAAQAFCLFTTLGPRFRLVAC